MPRPRTGSAYVRRGKIYLQITLNTGKRWCCVCPPRTDGAEVELRYARAVAADLQRVYNEGRWDPLTKTERPAETPASQEVVAPTVAEYALQWVAKQTYESAALETAKLERYLAKSDLGAMRFTEVKPKHLVIEIQTRVCGVAKRLET